MTGGYSFRGGTDTTFTPAVSGYSTLEIDVDTGGAQTTLVRSRGDMLRVLDTTDVSSIGTLYIRYQLDRKGCTYSAPSLARLRGVHIEGGVPIPYLRQ